MKSGLHQQILDEPPAVVVRGLPARTRVHVTATCRDAAGVAFSSWAEFESDVKGIVHIATATPHAGTFDGCDPFGLWWSMRASAQQPFTVNLNGMLTAVHASADGETVAEATIDRTFAVPGMSSAPFHTGGVIGALFLPVTLPAPAVITLGGSGGGLHWAEPTAALLAAHGFVALALAYFGLPHLPPSLAEVPVEYVHAAAAAVRRQDTVAGDGIGIVATSRGAELGLLAASLDPTIAAVVGYCASTVLWSSVDVQRAQPCAAWTVNGVPAPYVVPDPDAVGAALSQPTIRLSGALATALDSPIARRADIALERIHGAVLLVSGDDDRMWPSSQLAGMGMERLAAHNHPYERAHLRYPNAGHSLSQIPGLPAPETTVRHPIDGELYELGGSRADNARAALDAWPRVLTFLRRHLDAGLP